MKGLKDSFREENGQSLTLVAVVMTLLLAMAAVSVDLGYLFLQKRNLQNVADAASLAGARELYSEGVDGDLVLDRVKEYVRAHNIAESEIINEDEIKQLSSEDTHVTVILRGGRGLFFSRIFNILSSDVSARATAKIGPLEGVAENLVPIALTEEEFNKATEDCFDEHGNYTGGEEFEFIDFHIIGAANWGVLSFEGRGTGQTPPVISDYIENGYPGLVYKGDENVYTAPGAAGGGAQGDVRAAIESRYGQVVFVPVVRGSVNGSKWIEVIEFAAIRVGEMTGQGANIGLKGELVRAVGIGPVGSFPEGGRNPLGLVGVVLVE